VHADLDERARYVRTHAREHAPRAEQLRRVRQANQMRSGHRIDHVDARQIDDHVLRAAIRDPLQELLGHLGGSRRVDRADERERDHVIPDVDDRHAELADRDALPLDRGELLFEVAPRGLEIAHRFVVLFARLFELAQEHEQALFEGAEAILGDGPREPDRLVKSPDRGERERFEHTLDPLALHHHRLVRDFGHSGSSPLPPTFIRRGAKSFKRDVASGEGRARTCPLVKARRRS